MKVFFNSWGHHAGGNLLLKVPYYPCGTSAFKPAIFLLNFRWFFACVSISGVFAVTFSVVFAYVADCTEEQDRSQAYGLVSRKE